MIMKFTGVDTTALEKMKNVVELSEKVLANLEAIRIVSRDLEKCRENRGRRLVISCGTGGYMGLPCDDQLLFEIGTAVDAFEVRLLEKMRALQWELPVSGPVAMEAEPAETEAANDE
jgi:hypothetical protein